MLAIINRRLTSFLSYLMRPNTVEDYRYLHSLITTQEFGPVYSVHCSLSYYTDDDGNVLNGKLLIDGFAKLIITSIANILDAVEEIRCNPITRNLLAGINPFRHGRVLLSGMFEHGKDEALR